MANPRKIVPENVPGDFFVDTTCIDCDTCRQIAPEVFAEGPGTAYVHRQPSSTVARRAALRALLACPTGSIGDRADDDRKAVMTDFPVLVEEPVYYCGFNSPKSFGGNSYFIEHPEGNWLVDSPKFLPQLVRQFDARGGIAHIFLTHRDDVAGANRYVAHFGSRRAIHRAELSSQPGADLVLEGDDPTELAPGLVAIPTPGHTSGHCCLLFRDRFLFTGGSSRLRPGFQALGCFARLLLVFLDSADRIDPAIGELSLRVGAPGSRAARPPAGRRDAPTATRPRRSDDLRRRLSCRDRDAKQTVTLAIAAESSECNLSAGEPGIWYRSRWDSLRSGSTSRPNRSWRQASSGSLARRKLSTMAPPKMSLTQSSIMQWPRCIAAVGSPPWASSWPSRRPSVSSSPAGEQSPLRESCP
jgi:glyoxylase-like metal-dependent hydrolase (beta-lactamase superfamily II)/ferredoxin